MKFFTTCLSLILCSITLLGQSCLPGNNVFTSQTEIDNFLINHPNCTTIEGNLTITGTGITNLNGLQNITTFQGGLMILDCSVEDLSGLDNVTSVGDYFDLTTLPLIENLDELSNLTFIGGALTIMSCPLLTNLNGLENVESSPTHLMIMNNPLLANLNGLNKIQEVSTNLSVRYNLTLSDINALANISTDELTKLTIKDNPLLSVCHINSVCSALTNGLTDVTIENNDTDCNTVSEIEAACVLSVKEEVSKEIRFFPNPAQTEIRFDQNQMKSIRIFNSLGQQILTAKNVTTTMNVSNLSKGLYVIQIEYSDVVLKDFLVIE